MSEKNKINWFPGHMKKATDQIQDSLKNVDIVIEVVDSRCINSSSNYELLKEIKNKNKKYLKIALKADLADIDINQFKDDNNLLIGSILNKSFRNIIINKMNEIMKEKIDKLKSKGLVNPRFLVMVVGLPNVGKSSLINFLKQSNVLVSQNYPGVTKNQRIVSINKNYDIIDTPGIFIKNIDEQTIAYKLGLINSIKKEVLPIYDVLKYGIDFVSQHYLTEFLKYYKLDEFINFDEFLNHLRASNLYLLKNNEIDEQKIYDHLYTDLTKCKICKINYDI